MRAGFTFVEVLIAILIAALLVTTACAGLTAALRAERTAQELRDGVLVLQSEFTRHHLPALRGAEPRHPGWIVGARHLTDEDRDIGWRVLSLTPETRGTAALELALRER